MTNDGNDFAKRLERIQERSGDLGSPIETVGSGRSGSKTIAGVVFVVGIALIVGGGTTAVITSPSFQDWKGEFLAGLKDLTTFEMAALPDVHDILVESAFNSVDKQAQATLAENEEERRRTLIAPERDWRGTPPTDPVTTSRMGPEYGVDYAVSASGEAVALNAIVANFEPSGPNSVHGEIQAFEANENCTLRPIGADEKFVNINVSRTNTTGPIQTIHTESINEIIRDAAKEAIGEGHSPGLIKVPRGKMGILDVIVTDTSGPLYLALQTSSSNTLWNIHAAPGVEIAHIAMISGGPSALTGTIGNASFEAVRSSRDANQTRFYDFRGDPGDIECMTRPFRKPDESWGAWAGAKGGNSMDGNLLFGQDKGFDSYEFWFKDALGLSPTQDLIHAERAGTILVGEIPAEPITMPTAPTTVHMPTHNRIVTGTEAERESEIVGVYTDLIRAAAGGDHSEVMPAAISLDQQTDVVESEVSGGYRSLADRVMNSNDIASKVSLTDLNRERRVSFSVNLTLDDLLHEGEAMPPEEERHSYAIMRAPRHMMHFCEDTLIEIASKCKIFKATVHDRGDDQYQVRADFAYVPNYTIGDVERIQGGDFISAFIPDETEGNTHETPEDRRAFLISLKEMCDELRPEYGNCLIGTAGFYLDRPASFSSSDVRASAAGWLEVYQPDNPFEERNFQERVEALREAISETAD